VTDATPAAFAAHADSRRADDDIAEQLVHQDLDVVFGGGRGHLLPATAGGARRDGLDLLALLRARGVQVVGDAAAMERVTTGRVWGIFAPGPLAAEMDRVATAPEQPSLAQMTAKAIRLLQQNPHGFFLLVEGSQVDRANHANDPARAAREFLAFDDAVEQVLAFAAGAGRNRTLVIACPDHDTGGLSIGQRERTPQSVADLTAPLAGMQLSTEALATKIGGDRSADNIIANVEAWWSLRLAPQAVTEITNRLAAGIALDRALGEAVSRHHTAVGWTSSGHTGVDVPLWSFGPGRPVGLVDNTDIARSVALALRADLPALTRALFVDAREAFPQAQVDRSDKAHPALVVGTARLPLNGNILLRNGREQRFEGVVVDIEKTGRTYLPRQAADLLRVAD
jgi:alkaline phosphatase